MKVLKNRLLAKALGFPKMLGVRCLHLRMQMCALVIIFLVSAMCLQTSYAQEQRDGPPWIRTKYNQALLKNKDNSLVRQEMERVKAQLKQAVGEEKYKEMEKRSDFEEVIRKKAAENVTDRYFEKEEDGGAPKVATVPPPDVPYPRAEREQPTAVQDGQAVQNRQSPEKQIEETRGDSWRSIAKELGGLDSPQTVTKDPNAGGKAGSPEVAKSAAQDLKEGSAPASAWDETVHRVGNGLEQALENSANANATLNGSDPDDPATQFADEHLKSRAAAVEKAVQRMADSMDEYSYNQSKVDAALQAYNANPSAERWSDLETAVNNRDNAEVYYPGKDTATDLTKRAGDYLDQQAELATKTKAAADQEWAARQAYFQNPTDENRNKYLEASGTLQAAKDAETKNAGEAVSTILDVNPITGIPKAAAELVAGKNLVTGETLTSEQIKEKGFLMGDLALLSAGGVAGGIMRETGLVTDAAEGLASLPKSPGGGDALVSPYKAPEYTPSSVVPKSEIPSTSFADSITGKNGTISGEGVGYRPESFSSDASRALEAVKEPPAVTPVEAPAAKTGGSVAPDLGETPGPRVAESPRVEPVSEAGRGVSGEAAPEVRTEPTTPRTPETVSAPEPRTPTTEPAARPVESAEPRTVAGGEEKPMGPSLEKSGETPRQLPETPREIAGAPTRVERGSMAREQADAAARAINDPIASEPASGKPSYSERGVAENRFSGNGDQTPASVAKLEESAPNAKKAVYGEEGFGKSETRNVGKYVDKQIENLMKDAGGKGAVPKEVYDYAEANVGQAKPNTGRVADAIAEQREIGRRGQTPESAMKDSPLPEVKNNLEPSSETKILKADDTVRADQLDAHGRIGQEPVEKTPAKADPKSKTETTARHEAAKQPLPEEEVPEVTEKNKIKKEGESAKKSDSKSRTLAEDDEINDFMKKLGIEHGTPDPLEGVKIEGKKIPNEFDKPSVGDPIRVPDGTSDLSSSKPKTAKNQGIQTAEDLKQQLKDLKPDETSAYPLDRMTEEAIKNGVPKKDIVKAIKDAKESASPEVRQALNNALKEYKSPEYRQTRAELAKVDQALRDQGINPVERSPSSRITGDWAKIDDVIKARETALNESYNYRPGELNHDLYTPKDLRVDGVPQRGANVNDGQAIALNADNAPLKNGVTSAHENAHTWSGAEGKFRKVLDDYAAKDPAIAEVRDYYNKIQEAAQKGDLAQAKQLAKDAPFTPDQLNKAGFPSNYSMLPEEWVPEVNARFVTDPLGDAVGVRDSYNPNAQRPGLGNLEQVRKNPIYEDLGKALMEHQDEVAAAKPSNTPRTRNDVDPTYRTTDQALGDNPLAKPDRISTQVDDIRNSEIPVDDSPKAQARGAVEEAAREEPPGGGGSKKGSDLKGSADRSEPSGTQSQPPSADKGPRASLAEGLEKENVSPADRVNGEIKKLENEIRESAGLPRDESPVAVEKQILERAAGDDLVSPEGIQKRMVGEGESPHVGRGGLRDGEVPNARNSLEGGGTGEPPGVTKTFPEREFIKEGNTMKEVKPEVKPEPPSEAPKKEVKPSIAKEKLQKLQDKQRAREASAVEEPTPVQEQRAFESTDEKIQFLDQEVRDKLHGLLKDVKGSRVEITPEGKGKVRYQITNDEFSSARNANGERISLNVDGTVDFENGVVNKDNISFPDSIRSQGLGAEFEAQEMEIFKKLGINKVNLEAAGGYEGTATIKDGKIVDTSSDLIRKRLQETSDGVVIKGQNHEPIQDGFIDFHNTVGSYNWAKENYLPYGTDYPKLQRFMRDNLENIKNKISASDYDAASALIKSGRPEDVPAIANLNTVIPGEYLSNGKPKTIGKAILLPGKNGIQNFQWEAFKKVK